MGDRVAVTLTVLVEHADRVREIFEPGCGEADNEEDLGDVIEFKFDQVNYGNLGVEAQLRAAGIAYDKDWQQGGEFEAGTEYVRFNEAGEIRNFDVYTDDENPDIDQLVQLCDKPDELVKFILDFKRSVTAGPLDALQVEYGKRHQARNLIAEPVDAGVPY